MALRGLIPKTHLLHRPPRFARIWAVAFERTAADATCAGSSGATGGGGGQLAPPPSGGCLGASGTTGGEQRSPPPHGGYRAVACLPRDRFSYEPNSAHCTQISFGVDHCRKRTGSFSVCAWRPCSRWCAKRVLLKCSVTMSFPPHIPDRQADVLIKGRSAEQLIVMEWSFGRCFGVI